MWHAETALASLFTLVLPFGPHPLTTPERHNHTTGTHTELLWMAQKQCLPTARLIEIVFFRFPSG